MQVECEYELTAFSGQREGTRTSGTPAVELAGFGTALPRTCLGNAQLASQLGVTSEWIENRCGVRSRFVADDETTSSLAAEAARQAIAQAGTDPDFIICATFTPDYPMCPTAPTVARRLGLSRFVAAFDVNAACAGGVTALLMAFDLIQSKAAQSVLVVASDTTTRFLGDADRSTRIVFGDGAAAFLLRPAGDRACGMRLLARAQGCDGSGASLFHLSSPGPSSPGHQSGSVRMDGPALFRFAVETGTNMVGELIQCSGRSASEISRVIFHQANKRILDAIAARTTIPAERWVSNIAEVGNLASASALFASLGAGLVWAGAVLEF